MSELKFAVQGSSCEPYVVTIRKANDRLNAYCTCKAAENGTHCKHRIRILSGSDEAIVSENLGDLRTVSSWLANTEMERALRDFNDAEKELASAKRKLAKVKKFVSQTMMR